MLWFLCFSMSAPPPPVKLLIISKLKLFSDVNNLRLICNAPWGGLLASGPPPIGRSTALGPSPLRFISTLDMLSPLVGRCPTRQFNLSLHTICPYQKGGGWAPGISCFILLFGSFLAGKQDRVLIPPLPRPGFFSGTSELLSPFKSPFFTSRGR